MAPRSLSYTDASHRLSDNNSVTGAAAELRHRTTAFSGQLRSSGLRQTAALQHRRPGGRPHNIHPQPPTADMVAGASAAHGSFAGAVGISAADALFVSAPQQR